MVGTNHVRVCREGVWLGKAVPSGRGYGRLVCQAWVRSLGIRDIWCEFYATHFEVAVWDLGASRQTCVILAFCRFSIRPARGDVYTI